MAGAGGNSLQVALLSPCFWPEVRRGTERFVRDLADGLLARGHRPRLITAHHGLPRQSVEDGLQITRVPRLPEGWLEHLHFEQHLTHWPLSELVLRKSSSDVAHAVFPTDALAAARWSKATGRPSVLSYMGIPDHRGLMARRLRLEATLRAADGCSATVALSRTAAEAFWRWLGIEARVIHPGVDLHAFSPGTESFSAPTIFCGAAIGEPRKRVGLLVQAFALVRRERPEARLLLSRPSNAHDAAGLEDEGVELVDVDQRAALAEVYRRAWVSALPSWGEAFGLVLVEALASGTPVVATNLEGMREIVDREEIGRLFDGEDAAVLARALLEALELAEQDGTAAACRARAEDFSTVRTTESYLDLYRELLAN